MYSSMNPKFIIIAAVVLCAFLLYNQKLIYSQIEKIEKYISRKVIPLVEQSSSSRPQQSAQSQQYQQQQSYPVEPVGPVGRYSWTGHYISPEQAAINEKVLASRPNPAVSMSKQPRENPPEIPTQQTQPVQQAQPVFPTHDQRRPPPIQIPQSDPYDDIYGAADISTI